MEYFVYVLRSSRDGKRYIGITNNVERRIKQHMSGDVFSTKSRLPLKLEFTEKYPNRSSAREREKYFKTAAGRKFLNKNVIAEMVELADTHV